MNTKTNDSPRRIEYVDATPTWSEILPVLLSGAEYGVKAAREELQRMAKLADAYVAARKGGAL